MQRCVSRLAARRCLVECELQDRGFSLLELMVTVAIAGMLATLAAPVFDSMIRANRTKTVANELLASLNRARSEAIRRGQPVSICRSSDGSSCATSGTGWDSGWIVFVNEDNDKPAVRDSSELILQVRQNLPAGITVRPNNNLANFLTYSRTALANQRGSFAICSGADEPIKHRKPQVIVVIPTRVVLATDGDGNGIPEIDDGNGDLANLGSCESP
jgi:type IV fimbrial biogenesis protein FimT